jgi:hypothetical protein
MNADGALGNGRKKNWRTRMEAQRHGTYAEHICFDVEASPTDFGLCLEMNELHCELRLQKLVHFQKMRQFPSANQFSARLESARWASHQFGRSGAPARRLAQWERVQHYSRLAESQRERAHERERKIYLSSLAQGQNEPTRVRGRKRGSQLAREHSSLKKGVPWEVYSPSRSQAQARTRILRSQQFRRTAAR